MDYPVTLPGLRDRAEGLPPEVTAWEAYEQQLTLTGRTLLESPAARVEGNLQAFLERHPCLVPGFRSMGTPSGNAPYPAAVIRQPKLAGLHDKEARLLLDRDRQRVHQPSADRDRDPV